MMAWLSKHWYGMTAPDKLTWATIAESRSISNFNAYVSDALERWQSNDAPTDQYPATETETSLAPDGVGDGGVILAAVGEVGYATLTATPDNTDCSGAYGAVIYRHSAAPTPKTWAKAIAVVDAQSGSEIEFTDSPLDAATYHYKIAYFADDGAFGALSAADVTAVVT